MTLEKLQKDVGWNPHGWSALFTWEATFWVLAYYALSVVLQIVLPGTEVEGVKLKNGKKLKYKFNGRAMTSQNSCRIVIDSDI